MADALRVLITDEDPDSRVETRKARAAGRSSKSRARSGLGTAAVSVALEAHPDIILLAVEEPVQRPLQTAEALANALPETPFIIYSSMNDPEAIRRSMVFGAREYIVKPVQAAASDGGRQHGSAPGRAPPHAARGPAGRAGGAGSVITVTGAKGGIGKSVISVNLALALGGRPADRSSSSTRIPSSATLRRCSTSSRTTASRTSSAPR